MTGDSEPTISVIIPSFNYGHFLGDSLDSLQAQTQGGWECLVIDDGSTDDTRAMVEHYAAGDARIHYVYQANAGHAAARNLGLGQARGRYIQFLDADDVIQPEKFARQAAYLETHADMDIVYGAHRYFTDETLREALAAPLNPGEEQSQPEYDPDTLQRLMERNIMVTHAPLFRRSLVESVGFWDTALPAAEDWDFWLRCALAGAKFHFENWEKARALVRHHRASYSHDRRRMLEAILQVRDKVMGLTNDPALLAICRCKRWEEEAALGKYEGIYGNGRRGARLLCQAAFAARSPQWLLYALMLPLLRIPQIRAIPRIHQALRSFE